MDENKINEPEMNEGTKDIPVETKEKESENNQQLPAPMDYKEISVGDAGKAIVYHATEGMKRFGRWIGPKAKKVVAYTAGGLVVLGTAGAIVDHFTGGAVTDALTGTGDPEEMDPVDVECVRTDGYDGDPEVGDTDVSDATDGE